MKKLIYNILIATVLMSFFSCEDYLDIAPEAILTVEEVFKDFYSKYFSSKQSVKALLKEIYPHFVQQIEDEDFDFKFYFPSTWRENQDFSELYKKDYYAARYIIEKAKKKDKYAMYLYVEPDPFWQHVTIHTIAFYNTWFGCSHSARIVFYAEKD